MKAITLSKGTASEYSHHSLNIYHGCPHGCRYCFVPTYLRQSRHAFKTNRGIVKKASPDNIRYDLEHYNIPYPIHLCVMCDPYPTGWDTSRTRDILQSINASGGHFQIQTKNGPDAMRDFDLFSVDDWFGVTLTCDNEVDSIKWEPGASPPSERIKALLWAKEYWGISTYVSFEPVLDPAQTLRLIEAVAGFVDFAFIGKLTTFGNPYYPSDVQRLEAEIDWVRFRTEAEELCKCLGLEYQVKWDLAKIVTSRKRETKFSDKIEVSNESTTEPTQYQKGLRFLRKALNDPTVNFRDGQWETVEQLVQERTRMLVVQCTGWGKSLVYFLATRMLRERGAGPTLLISPLLSLMRDQIRAAERLGLRASSINSSNRNEWQQVKEQLRNDQVDILLVSPERLANDEFREQMLKPVASKIGLFVVDEAHCISDWGHDFRPDYRRIVRILQALPKNIPVLATTATANNRVVEDIKNQLGTDLHVVRGPLARESLRLQNIKLPDQADRMAWLAEQLPRLPGSGIVYALTIKDTEVISQWLQLQGIDAHPYHGRMDTSRRKELELKLLKNRVKVLVATTSLGMGFDKPDMGFVIHFQRPGSVVHYYQQVGRAGRAIDQAYGIMLTGDEDQEIIEYFINTAFPPEAHTSQVLKALEQAEDGLTVNMIEQHVNLSRGQIKKVLKLLAVETPSPVAKDGPRWYATAVNYVPDRAKIKRLTAIRHYEQDRMQAYMQNTTCLMAFLQEELDDPKPIPCGCCTFCVGRALLPETCSNELANQAAQFLRHRNEHPIKPCYFWPSNALAQYDWQGSIPIPLRAEEGRVLSFWNDAGWGNLVKAGKSAGHFDDVLVNSATEMTKKRWQPTPAPEWVTCVPSLNKPILVPDLAQRLATSLGLPYVECIYKIRATEPQKLMRNSYCQARNIAGAFEVDHNLTRRAPVLLIDDVVDSRWTFTVIAALLRSAGSGAVFPLALADTSLGGY